MKEGEWAHDFMLKLGFGSYIAVINSLIVVSWNTMICVYVVNALLGKE